MTSTITTTSLHDLCLAGEVEAVQIYLRQQQQQPDLNHLNVCMATAAVRGQIHVVQLLIDRGASDWDQGLRSAAEGGHMPIVLLMIERGADLWDWGLYFAAKGGHMHIVQLMIQRGASIWDWGMRGAAKGGHMHIVHQMIQRGSDDWNGGLHNAALGGHMHIVQLMIERGASNWNTAMHCAAEAGYMPIVLLMIERGAVVWSADTVKLLHARPYEVIHLSRCGHVARHVFAKHSPLFVQWIQEDEQIRAKARALLMYVTSDVDNNDKSVTLLHRELCELALSY